MSGKLFVVATPIGNREDITERAKKTLKEVDYIAAEDTRNTLNLLRFYNLSNKLISNYKYNEQKNIKKFLSYLSNDKNIAIVSDAGTPCISDPGEALVKAALENDIEVVGVCGANAAITAISISGLDCETFSFYGFLSRKKGKIKKELLKAKEDSTSVSVFYESPKRIKKTIEYISEIDKESKLCVCNDLTKRFEKTYRGNPTEVLEQLNNNYYSEKGEYTIVVEFTTEEINVNHKAETVEGMLVNYMINNDVSLKEAVGCISKRGIPKNVLYAASLNLKRIINQDKQGE